MSIHLSKKSIAILAVCACTLVATYFAPALRADENSSAPPAKTEKQKAQQEAADRIKTEPGAEEPKAKAAWKTDLVAFDKYLGELTAKAHVPTKEALAKRITAKPGGGGLDTEVMPITDGAGGFVDLKPAKNTVQYCANEALKGQKVEWDLELAADASENYLGIMMLHPKWDTKPDAKEKKAVPFLNTIIVKAPKVGPLKAGERVRLKGTIGDSSSNKGISLFSGPVAIYHLDASPHTVFWVGLEKVTITRLDP